MSESVRLLIVDDDEDILTAGRLLLRRRFGAVDVCANPDELPALFEQHDYAAVLLDMNFGPGESSGATGMRWLRWILEQDSDAVVVLITAHGDVSLAVEAMKIGATDFVSKPWENEKLIATLSAGIALRSTRNEAARLRSVNQTLARRGEQSMLGSSAALRQLQALIARAAPTDANVLIMGENGTGKELAARDLHRQSNRADGTFMAVDLGAISESLFDSELFGHVAGAFTGAKGDHPGRIASAHGGTLFLDEIGNLPLHLQPKLLTALEQRQVTPVGATRPVAVDIRVVAATNLSPAQLRDESRFRQDLLFRLNTVELVMPPLRERSEDIPEIAAHYVDLYARRYGRAVSGLAPAALDAICSYSWPGNVRALRHAIERAVILAAGDQLQPQDFSLGTTAGEIDSGRAASASEDEVLNLEQLEKRAIERALTRHGYNISRAAKDLGVTRAALYRRMEKHGL